MRASSVQAALVRVSDKSGNRHIARFGEASTVQFDALDFMQRFGSQVTFAAVRTSHYGHILDHQQVLALAVTSCDVPDLRPTFAADFTGEGFGFLVIRHRP